MSYLRKATVEIQNLGQSVDLTELPAIGAEQMNAAIRDGRHLLGAAIAVKYGMAEWRDTDPEQILSELPSRTIIEIAEAVAKLSGLDEPEGKNSESTPASVSNIA